MRILYVVAHWPNFYITYIFAKMAWMRARGHHVAVASLRREGPPGDARLHGFELDDVPVVQLEAAAGPEARVAGEALAFARAQRAELVVAEGARAEARVARDIQRDGGLPYVIHMHGGDVHSNPAPDLAEFVAHAAAVCPVSTFLADVLVGARRVTPAPAVLPIAVPASKLRVLPNAVPAWWVADAPAPQRPGRATLGTIGRLSPVKDHLALIDAVAALAPEIPALSLRIIGGGDLRDALLERAALLGVGARVEITGPLPWREVMRAADDLDVYAQASRLEGFCMATVEGAARGLPVIATRTGIHEECVVPGENGVLVEPGDTASLHAGIAALLAAGPAERRRMGAASLAVVRERFVEDRVTPRVEAVYQAAASGRALPP